jgi:hypothetical protein
MQTEPKSQRPMIERMERALVLLAYFIELDGDVHVPMYEKFEAELEELKKKEDAKDRARRLLLSYKRSGEGKAIAPKRMNLLDPGGSLLSRCGAPAIKL